MLSVSPSPNRWIKMIIDYIFYWYQLPVILKYRPLKAKPQQRKGKYISSVITDFKMVRLLGLYYASMA